MLKKIKFCQRLLDSNVSDEEFDSLSGELIPDFEEHNKQN